MRTHAQTRIVAKWKRRALTARALHAIKSGRNSGMLVKKLRTMTERTFSGSRLADESNIVSEFANSVRGDANGPAPGESDHGTTTLHVVFHQKPQPDALQADQALSFFSLFEWKAAMVR